MYPIKRRDKNTGISKMVKIVFGVTRVNGNFCYIKKNSFKPD